MQRIIVFFLPFWAPIWTAAANPDPNYAVAGIPAALLKGANVVKRMETIRFTITEKNRATFYQKVAYTILNEQGDDWSYFSEGYDKLRGIESFEGTLYDAGGNKIKSLKKADIKDVSGSDDASLADDNRVKWHNFFYKNYPYTVEYEVEVRYKGTMFLPRWIPQERPVMGVEQSSLTVVSPDFNPLQYKMFNYKGEPVISSDSKSNKIYNWEVKGIAAVESEYAAPPWYQLTTSVFMTTRSFMLEDYEGSNANWKDFGKFVYDLKKDRDVLPDDIKQKVRQLTEGVADIKEKVRRLYEYMQQNTRYISIQLGVGGWQPFDAKYVSSKKYGDCKALSNYMYALLKEAGIRSVYTVIYAGSDDNYLIKDLPFSQFNHVILFVPHEKDTTWLECTSQTLPAGYLGDGTDNRFALAIDENGGTLVRTPRYGVNENLELRHTTASIDAEGHLSALIKTKYMAGQQDRLHAVINGLSKDKLMEFLKEDIELPTYDVKSFNYKEEKGPVPAIDETLELVAMNYATVSGKRLFVLPNIITRSNRKLKPDEDRRYDILLGFEFRDIDTAELKIPAGYIPESVPQPVKLETKFGKYQSTVKLEENKIIYYRHYEHYSGRYPATDYPDLLKFYESVYKADRARVVLVKTETTKGF